jgi:hypothetical protein
MRYVVGSKLHGKNLGRNTNLFITRSFLLFGCLELVASLGIYQSAVTNARFAPVRRESCSSNRSIWIWQSLWRWAKRRHPHKPSQWVMRKYWHSWRTSVCGSSRRKLKKNLRKKYQSHSHNLCEMKDLLLFKQRQLLASRPSQSQSIQWAAVMISSPSTKNALAFATFLRLNIERGIGNDLLDR